MSEHGDGTQFTLLGGVDAVDAGVLSAHYGYPEDLTRCWVRGNMITSVDGAATSGGKSGALGGDADRAVFGALRALARHHGIAAAKTFLDAIQDLDS